MRNSPSSQASIVAFPIPDPAIARHPDTLLNPRGLRRWIEELPLANPPRAAQMLLQQIRMLARDPQPGPKLGALLELYLPALEPLMRIALDRAATNADSAVPLDQLEHVLLEILAELAFGHLRIANDQLISGKPASHDSLFRAMSLLESAKLIECLHYRRSELQHWQLQLQIFQLAEFQQIASKRAGKPLSLDAQPDTIEGLFFRTLVVSLADPNHHRPSQVLSWLKWATQHTHRLSLAVLPEGPFAIPVDVSGAQTPLQSARRGKPGTDTRYLSTESFLQALNEDAQAPQGLHQALDDLIRGRKSPEQRKSPRQQRNHPYRLLHGLRYIHNRLTELTQGDTRQSASTAPVECLQINQSRSGAAFRLGMAPAQPLTVGEPVLLETDPASGQGPPVGFAARIQRLVSDDAGEVEVGVQKLPGRLIPVTLTGKTTQRARGDIEALLQEAEDGKYTLIMTRRVYRAGELLTVESANARYSLRLGELQASTQRCAYADAESVDA